MKIEIPGQGEVNASALTAIEGMNVKQIAQFVAFSFSSAISPETDALAPFLIAVMIRNNYDPTILKQMIKSGAADTSFVAAANAIHSTKKEDIAKALQSSKVVDIESAREYVAKNEKFVAGLTLAEKVNVAKAFHTVLPDALSTLSAISLEGKTVEEYAIAENKMSLEERAQKVLENSKEFGTSDVVDLIYSITQNVTAENLKVAAVNFLDTVNAQDIVTVAQDGYAFAKDLMSIIKTQGVIDVKNKAAAKKFGAGLKGIFNAVASSLDIAGIAMDPAIKRKIDNAFAKVANNNAQPKKAIKKRKTLSKKKNPGNKPA